MRLLVHRLIPISEPWYNVPKVPVAQPFTHATLQDHVGIRPASHEPAQVTAKSRGLASFSIGDATSTTLQYTAQQVLRVQHLAHLLPHGDQVARQSRPGGLVDRVLSRAAVFARDGGGQVVAISRCAASRARVFNVAS